MDAPELTKQAAAELIDAFLTKVKSKAPQPVYDSLPIDGETSNRGNKLKYGAELVHRDRINGFNNDIETVETVEYNRSTRTVFKRRRLDTYNIGDPDYENSDEEDSPYLDLDLEEILRPISHPSELSSRKTISRTYTSDVMKHYAQQSIEMIEKEQETVIKLSGLLDLLLGEDSNLLLEDGLQIPDYDHGLKETAEADKENRTERRVTRKSTTQGADPFFALPKFQSDPNQGLPAELAEEARQLTQLTVQRAEEFISNLTQVRNGLARAQTVKEKLYAWGREMNGDPDESDIYVAEKEAAAKAAQAEKEAKGIVDSSSSSGRGTATPQPTGRRGGRRRAQ